MKYTTIIGTLLIAIGLVASFVGKINFGELIAEPEFSLGILFGGGIGILLGGFLGWLYKKPYAATKSNKSVSNPTDSSTLN